MIAFTHDYSFPFVIEISSDQSRILMLRTFQPLFTPPMTPAFHYYLQHAGRLDDAVSRALTSETINEEPRSVLPETPLHVAMGVVA